MNSQLARLLNQAPEFGDVLPEQLLRERDDRELNVNLARQPLWITDAGLVGVVLPVRSRHVPQ